MLAQKNSPACSSRSENKQPGPGQVFCPDNCFVVCVQIAKGRVVDAWSSGRMMRNVNLILRDEVDEYGHPCFVRNAHCLCNDGHAMAAVRALENLAWVTLPRSAQLVRSMVQALRFTQEHLLHFYQFHLSNWVCSEGKPGAEPFVSAWAADCCEHPEIKDTKAFARQVHRNSLASLLIQAQLKTALGLLGCRDGAYAAFQMGGLPTDLDLGPGVLQQLRGLMVKCRDFVCAAFLKDLEQVARIFPHWKNLAPGSCFLCRGDFVRPHDNGWLFPGGVLCLPEKNRLESLNIDSARTDLVREDKNPEWQLPGANFYGLNFGKNGPVFHLAKGNFHGLCPLRHGNDACETGPLARVMGAFAQNQQAVVRAVNQSVKACGMLPHDLNSALGRLLSRGIEASVLAESTLMWLDELEGVLGRRKGRGSKDIHLPVSGVGTGTVEVSRGTLIHTIHLKNNRIVSHDYLTPSQWNMSPRDSAGRRGPLEQALLETPIFDPGFPLEILRIVQGFDPCNACHVVVKDRDTGRTTLVKG